MCVCVCVCVCVRVCVCVCVDGLATNEMRAYSSMFNEAYDSFFISPHEQERLLNPELGQSAGLRRYSKCHLPVRGDWKR